MSRHLGGLVLLLAVLAGDIGSAWGAETKPATPNSKPRLEVTVNPRRISRMSGSDYDNRAQSVCLEIRVVSREMTRNLQGLKAELYAIGKNITTRDLKLLGSDVLEFDLLAKGTYTGHGEAVSFEFDDHDTVKFGAKYQGHLVVIKDGDDQIIATNATKPEYLKGYDQIKKLTKGKKKDFTLGSSR